MSIKNKAVDGFLWNALGQLSQVGVEFVVGIILARLLSPREFGLIGMLLIVIAISEVIINSGFSSALIQRQDCTDKDYSTIFIFNFIAGLSCYLLIYICAPHVSNFYNEPILTDILRILGVTVPIGSLTLIQRTLVIKEINFSLNSRILIISSTVSGFLAILVALNGWGVWALVVKQVGREIIMSALYWFWNRWLPTLVFSLQSFRNLWKFSSNLLISNLIFAIFNNIYLIFIGKVFSPRELGFYTRADLFKNIPGGTVSKMFTDVAFPSLSKIEHEPKKLKEGFKRVLMSAAFIIFILMLGMAASAESLILALIGEKWRPSIIYLQLLCFSGMMFPLIRINMMVLKVVGRSDLFLKSELIDKVLIIPITVVGYFFGLRIMIISMFFGTIISFFIFSNLSAGFTGYSFKEQFVNILPGFLIALFMGGVVFVTGKFLVFAPLVNLMIQIILGAIIVFAVSERFKNPAYLYIKKIALSKIS